MAAEHRGIFFVYGEVRMSPLSVVRFAMVAAVACVPVAHIMPARALAGTGAGQRAVAVSGHGVDLENGAIVYSELKTAAGLVRSSTVIVELEGDLHGRVLYQVTTRIDSARGTLTNTGQQVFSGTVAGSGPVMLYDDRFLFEVNLATGVEHGTVQLVHHLAGPRVRCTLEVSGTGKDASGNPTFSYSGQCAFGASRAAAG